MLRIGEILQMNHTMLFQKIIIPGAKKWEAHHEDKEKEIRMLNLDLSKIEEDVVIENKEDPLNKFKLKFFKVHKYIYRVLHIFPHTTFPVIQTING